MCSTIFTTVVLSVCATQTIAMSTQHEIQRRDEPFIEIPLEYNNDLYAFTTSISIGTPPQPVNLHLTTQDQTWVPSTCASATCSSGTFNTSNSSTFQRSHGNKTTSIKYPDGTWATITLGHDTFHLTSSYSTANFEFGISTKNTPYPKFGLLPHLQSSNNTAFSISSQRVIFGGIGTAINDFETFNSTNSIILSAASIISENGEIKQKLLPPNDWSYRNNDKPYQLHAEIQLGTSSLYLPPTILTTISTLLNAKWNDERRIFTLLCTQPPPPYSLQLSFGHVTINLPFENLIAKYSSGCFLLLRDATLLNKGEIILGVPFLRSAGVVVFDYGNERVSIASSTSPSSSSTDMGNIIPIPKDGIPFYTPPPPSKPILSTAVIAGIVLAAVCFVLILLLLTLLYIRRRHRNTHNNPIDLHTAHQVYLRYTHRTGESPEVLTPQTALTFRNESNLRDAKGFYSCESEKCGNGGGNTTVKVLHGSSIPPVQSSKEMDDVKGFVGMDEEGGNDLLSVPVASHCRPSSRGSSNVSSYAISIPSGADVIHDRAVSLVSSRTPSRSSDNDAQTSGITPPQQQNPSEMEGEGWRFFQR